jgi:hypothetical protein
MAESNRAQRASIAADPQAAARRLRAVTHVEESAGQLLLGIGRDVVQGTADSLDDLSAAADQWVYNHTGIMADQAYRDRTRLNLPDVADVPIQGSAVVRDIGEFAVTYMTALRATRGVTAMGTVARVSPRLAAGSRIIPHVARATQATVAGSASAFVDHDPMTGNLLNMAQEMGIAAPAVLEALAVDESDGALEARLKNAAADAVFGVAFDAAIGTFTQMVKGVRAFRRIDADLDEILGVPEAVQRVTPPRPTPAVATAVPVTANPRAAPAAAVRTVDEAAPAVAAADDAVEATDFITTPNVVAKRVARMSEGDLGKLADDIFSGDPVRTVGASERLGLHPDRVDLSAALSSAEGPEAVLDILVRTADAIGDLSQSYGSKPRTWKQSAALSNILGVHPSRVLEVFQGRTKHLDALAFLATRQVADGAVDLMRASENARKYVGSPESPEWMAFVSTLDSQTVLHGMLKGSASNVARALGSFKAVTKASSSAARRKTLQGLVGAPETPEVDEAMEAFRKMAETTNPAERLALIDKIKKSGGDLRSLSAIIDAGSSNAALRRALREHLVNTIWSVGTAKAQFIGTVLHGAAKAASRGVMHGYGLVFAGGRGQEFAIERAADAAYLVAMSKSVGPALGRVVHLLADTALHEGRLIVAPTSRTLGRGVDQLHKTLNDRFGPYSPSTQRPDYERSTHFAIQPETIDALVASKDQLPTLLRIGFRSMLELAATSVNVVGATGRIVRALTIETGDELFGSITLNAGRAAHASRKAMAEGYGRGLKGKDLEDYATTRSTEYFENTSEEMLSQLEAQIAAGALKDSPEVLAAAQTALARMDIDQSAMAGTQSLLLQDGLETGLAKGVSGGLRAADKFFGDVGILFPIVHTPLRSIEVALKEYTPLGMLAKATRERVMSGGPDSAVVLAQMAVGSTVLGWAASQAMAGNIVGYDGGPKSSTRLTRPQYSIKIGDTWHEFSRYDPATLPLGFAADLVEYEWQLDQENEDGTSSPMLMQAAEAMFLAIKRNILSRNFMRTVADYATILSDTEGAQGDAKLESLAALTAARLVPAIGMGKWWEGEDSEVTHEAVTMWEKTLKGSGWFAGSLPERVDPLLGRPVGYNRDGGVNTTNVTADPLYVALEGLAFDLPADSKSYLGVDLSSQQRMRLKVIRGQEAIGPTGVNLETRLRDHIASYEWGEMNRAQKLALIRRERAIYHREAINLLKEEDPSFGLAADTVKERKRLEETDGLTGPSLAAAVTDYQRVERFSRGISEPETSDLREALGL